MNIQVDSINTKVKKCDEHLQFADFFDTKQYPELAFKGPRSRHQNGLEVTGAVTLHGKSIPLAFEFVGGRTAEFPEGVHQIGDTTSIILKRSGFDMKTMPGTIGNEVHAEISREAVIDTHLRMFAALTNSGHRDL